MLDRTDPGPASAGAGAAQQRPLSGCCLYLPGHQVHWIQVNHARGDAEHRPEEGRLLAVEDDGLVVIDVDGEERRLWNHDPSRLSDLVARQRGRVFHQPRWGLLRSPSESNGSYSCFCVTEYDNPGRVPCAAVVPGDTVLDRFLSAGGGILTPDDLLALDAELEDR